MNQTKHLLTPSLHDAFRWYGIIEDKPKQEVLDTLLKKEIEQTEAMKAGNQFEDYVFRTCRGEDLNLAADGDDDAYARCVNEVADIVRGGLWQERLSRDIRVNGMPFLLYGKLDTVKRDWIYDIKYSGSYEIGKYEPSIQHLSYMYMTGIEKFAYLITDGKNVMREEYFWSPDSEAQLFAELSELVGFIWADREFKAAYMANWKCKYQETEQCQAA